MSRSSHAGGGADWYPRGRSEARTAYFQDSKIVLWANTDQRGGKLATVSKLDLRFGGALDDMEICDNMAGLVPYETRAGTARHAIDIACPEIGHPLPCRYEDDGLACVPEQVDCRTFICAKIASRSDDAWFGDRSGLVDQEGC